MAYPPITSLGTVPQRTQTPAEFAANADSFLGALPNFRTELNAFGAYVDAAGASIDFAIGSAVASATSQSAASAASAFSSANIALSGASSASNDAMSSASSAASALAYKDIAASNANFKGLWSSLTGALNVPAMVYHNGLYWNLTVNLVNVTTAEPGVSSLWIVANGDSFRQIVDGLFSRALLDFNFVRNKYFAYEQYGLEPKQLTSALQTLRATTETYTNPFGLQTAAINTPSIEYDGNTGEPLGLNSRPTSTNLLLHSQYTAASGETAPTGWTAAQDTGTTTTAASTRFPTAVRMTASGSTQREIISQAVTLAAATTYTFSCYFAQGTAADDNVMRVITADAPTGTLTLAGSAVTSAGVYSVTFTTSAGGSYTVYIGLGCSGNATGTVIHETPQLEVGSFYTGYIPTTTAQVTRAAAQHRRDLGGDFNLSGGVFYVEFVAQSFGNLERLIAIGDSSTQECSINYGNAGTSNKIIATIRVGATNVNLSAPPNFVAGQLIKAALRYVRNANGTYGWTFFIGGVTGSSITTTALPSSYNKLAVGCRRYNSDTLQPYTPIRRAVYIGGVMASADVQAITL